MCLSAVYVCAQCCIRANRGSSFWVLKFFTEISIFASLSLAFPFLPVSTREAKFGKHRREHKDDALECADLDAPARRYTRSSKFKRSWRISELIYLPAAFAVSRGISAERPENSVLLALRNLSVRPADERRKDETRGDAPSSRAKLLLVHTRPVTMINTVGHCDGV